MWNRVEQKDIFVTKPFLPPIEEYQAYLNQIWENEWLTNSGPLLNELEQKLKYLFDVNHFMMVTNGTVALQIAIRALGLSGEIITTPFSYVATTSSIVWEHCKPVMVDISPRSLNIDPEKIEQVITEKTSAILATHVFGNPCDVNAIAIIAKKYGLKVIYDAAHGFGTALAGRSLLSYGDISIASFHATKLFHTGEGGGLTTSDPELAKRIELMRNFGHASLTEFNGVGINGKCSELHAAMGLSVLKYVPEILERRRFLSILYIKLLAGLPLRFQEIADDTEYNWAYFPVIFESVSLLLEVMRSLEEQHVYPRRYFYPSLSQLPYVLDQVTPIADDISRRVLCLPLYHTLSECDVEMICKTMREVVQDMSISSRSEILLTF